MQYKIREKFYSAQKFLSVFLTAIILLGVFSVSTPVIAAEVNNSVQNSAETVGKLTETQNDSVSKTIKNELEHWGTVSRVILKSKNECFLQFVDKVK